MADKRFAVVVLTEGLADKGLDTEGVTKLCGGELVDATEASLTYAVDSSKAAKKAVKALVGKGLEKDENVFEVEVEVPAWLEQYREVSDSMLEHGG